MEHFDVVIVGAGLHGLCAAHTFLTIQPSLKLLIIDEKSHVGGCWAREQIYPHLRANNLQGYYEFTDFPILQAGVGVRERGVLSGAAISTYLEKYAENFDLIQRTKLKTQVRRAKEDATDPIRTWTVDLKSTETSETIEDVTTITCAKLIVATGQASRPNVPQVSGLHNFQGPVFHTEKLGREGVELASDPAISHLTIIGGGKSAHDAAYMFVKAGKRVTMFLRKSGKGGTPMAKSYTQMGPYSVWLEGLLMTRCLSWFGPCPWGDADGFGWIRWLLHGTAIGRFLVRCYFTSMDQNSRKESGILEDEKSKLLLPDTSMYWYGTQANVLGYDTDFYSLIRSGQVDVVRDEIDHFEAKKVHLVSGKSFNTDAIVMATVYNFGPSFPLKPRDKNLNWGMPVLPSEDTEFSKLDNRADAELLKSFPELERRPDQMERHPELTPWRLWRFMAPPSQVCAGPRQRNLVFFTSILTLQTATKAELTSLWAYAYLFDKLTLQPVSENEVTYEAAMWSRFGWWSRPVGLQGKLADFFHESMPFYDRLLKDLRLSNWRRGNVLSEVFGRWYEIKDYKDIVEEWMSSRRPEPKSLLSY